MARPSCSLPRRRSWPARRRSTRSSPAWPSARQALGHEASELSTALRSYVFGLEASPGRLEEVEERLALFARLERKHGGSIADVLAHAERCRARREELERVEIALSEVEASLGEARAELDRLAGELSSRRREAAPALAAAVRERLAELAMPDAEFEVEVRPREDGCGARGADEVSLVIAPNPGMPAGPLARDRLGRRAVTGDAGDPERGASLWWRRPGVESTPGGSTGGGPLLVFDEIDAGIGGHTARAVGEHLRALAEGRQILCITHLPAGRGDGRAPLHDRQGLECGAGADDRVRRSTATRSSASSSGCSAPPRATAPRAATLASCLRAA